eukprot:3495710-Pyramimonas_sp.AAC.1
MPDFVEHCATGEFNSPPKYLRKSNILLQDGHRPRPRRARGVPRHGRRTHPLTVRSVALTVRGVALTVRSVALTVRVRAPPPLTGWAPSWPPTSA